MNKDFTKNEGIETKNKEVLEREETEAERLAREEKEFEIKGLNEALDITKEKEEKVRPIVDEVYEKLYSYVEDNDKDFDMYDACSTLAKTGIYLSQSYFENKEEFDKEYKISKELVSNNILMSLGLYAGDEELNKNAIVTYNGEYDINNFSLRRILMISMHLTEYALWQLTLTKTFKRLSGEDDK